MRRLKIHLKRPVGKKSYDGLKPLSKIYLSPVFFSNEPYSQIFNFFENQLELKFSLISIKKIKNLLQVCNIVNNKLCLKYKNIYRASFYVRACAKIGQEYTKMDQNYEKWPFFVVFGYNLAFILHEINVKMNETCRNI